MVESSGKIPFIVGGKTFHTWYRVIGDLKGGKRPLVLLHGGPGLSHDYLLPFKRMNERLGIPVVFYDQIGTGKSSHYRNCPDKFWTPSLFSDELKNLLRRLDIYRDYDLYGHSWGGFLAAHFSCSRETNGLHRLILSNSAASMQLMEDGLNLLLDGFGTDFASMMRRHEANGTLHSAQYKEGMSRFETTHVYSLKSRPPELQKSYVANEEDPTVTIQMLGRRMFKIDGSLRGETVVPFLRNITVPTLVISSDRDQTHDIAMRPFLVHIPNVQSSKMSNSTHFPMYEEPDKYFKLISEFIS